MDAPAQPKPQSVDFRLTQAADCPRCAPPNTHRELPYPASGVVTEAGNEKSVEHIGRRKGCGNETPQKCRDRHSLGPSRCHASATQDGGRCGFVAVPTGQWRLAPGFNLGNAINPNRPSPEGTMSGCTDHPTCSVSNTYFGS